MADPVLHIKDSYYFEVPKVLLPARYTDKAQFPNVWVKNDDQFQHWEAERLYHEIEQLAGDGIHVPEEKELIEHWSHWQHEDHVNFARPLDVYLEMKHQALQNDSQAKRNAIEPDQRTDYTFADYLEAQEAAHNHDVWVGRFFEKLGGVKSSEWQAAKQHAGGKEAIQEFKANEAIQWSEQKIAAYNEHLSGKILLDDQPFGELRNLYEPESGFCISRFMILEVVIGILLFVVFGWVAGRLRSGAAPRGRLWNFFEVFLLFIRDQIARPAIGAHHDEHEEHHPHHDPTGVKEGHGTGGAGIGGAPVEVDKVHDRGPTPHKKHGHHHHHNPYADADRFVPLLWTIFFFVLFCNLFGAIPWLGAPTGSFGTTLGLALVTFATVVAAGMAKFGFLGFFANQVPSMDLPWYMAIILKPMIFAIEMLGLLIKHAVLAIRLLANMVAGHLAILAVLGLAFGAHAALTFTSPDVPGWQWWVVATIAVIGSTLFNVLELFVAFLQAYVFTFLSALFIGASVHKH